MRKSPFQRTPQRCLALAMLLLALPAGAAQSPSAPVEEPVGEKDQF